MQFRKVSVDKRIFASLLRCCVAVVLLSTSAEAMADDVPSDVINSPARQAFLAGTSKDCPGCDLRGVSLKRRDLSGADLTGADLTDAVLHAARLTNAKLATLNCGTRTSTRPI